MNSELLDSAGMMKISDLLTYVAGMVAAQGNDPDSGNATDLERDLHAAAKSLARRAAYEAALPCVTPDDVSAPAEQPDYLQLPETRLTLVEWRQNGFDARLGTLESNNASALRLTALEERLASLEEWADIEYAPVDENPAESIHDLIAAGMTGVTTDMHEQLERLKVQVKELGDVLINALMKIDALENKAPC